MIRCLDIHTHHPAPQPEAVVAVTMDNFSPLEQQWYSIGIHPWESQQNITAEMWQTFESCAANPAVVAIGECGIDKIKGGFLFKQLIVMNRQIDISEKLEKPLIIHDVKAHDVITGLKRDLNPKQNWAIHGFRAKPTVAKMFTDLGVYLSFGEKFNNESLLSVPQELILAETDESELTIQEIIAALSTVRGTDLTEIIAENTRRFLGKSC